MAKFIAVLGGRGGAGRTTHSINLGLSLVNEGESVILVDGNLDSPAVGLHLGGAHYPLTLHDVMRDSSKLVGSIYEHESGLKLIPADFSISSHQKIDFDSLFRNLQDLHLFADYVLVDGSAGVGHNTAQLLRLCDQVFIVTSPDMASVMEARRIIDLSKKLNKLIVGLVINKYKKSKYLTKKEDIEAFLGIPALSVIPRDFRFLKAMKEKKPYVYMFPKRKVSKNYAELAKRLSVKGL
ncbi:MAG: MinD/ParA family protein [Candidatus Woesearchaeota archaeon]